MEEQLASDNAGTLTTAIIILAVLLLGSTLINYINSGLTSIILLSILFLLVLIFLYKSKMNQAYAANKKYADYRSFAETDNSEYLLQKLNYLRSGIDIKMQRTAMTRLIYKCLFPLFLINLRVAFHGDAHLIWIALIAIALSTVVWHYFFTNNLEDLRIDAAEVESMITKARS